MHVPIGARPGPYPRLAYARQDDRARLLFLAPTPYVRGRSPVSDPKERNGELSQSTLPVRLSL